MKGLANLVLRYCGAVVSFRELAINADVFAEFWRIVLQTELETSCIRHIVPVHTSQDIFTMADTSTANESHSGGMTTFSSTQ